MKIKAVDHVALTVPDLQEATRFFEQVFDGEILVDGPSEVEPSWAGPWAETSFGLPKGSAVTARRVMNIGGTTNIELFCFSGTTPQRAAHTYDYGLQHFAVRVDNLSAVARRILLAGGKLYADPSTMEAVRNGQGPKEGWMYVETPWGSVIELVTFKEA
jgi:catechol 2,3-dioxygenase-like lactoylglutathione lyase family enzyme